ncbi:BREX system ATP-binding domain-containing protein [Streptomyces sp. KL116D]|uniref:BREX system ATP-binding domain-containing protein n=1 Tax=Streptomyces sp. KL116D TaxID=3045152 RepID=UPI003557C5BF
MIASPLPDLVGRQRECAALDALLAGLSEGGSSTLVVRGEAGMGKSVLLEYAAAQASRVKVTWAHGIEADMELPYASLHQVCTPFLGELELDELPEPQRDALRVAFGIAAGDPPDRFLVGLAVRPCSPAPPRPGRCSSWSTTPSGWTKRPCRPWSSWPADCSPSRSPWRSPYGTPEGGTALNGLPTLRLEGLTPPRRDSS